MVKKIKFAIEAQITLGAFLLASACTPQVDSPKEETPSVTMSAEAKAQIHVEKANALATDQFLKVTAKLQCRASGDMPEELRNPGKYPAMQVFDNLYFVGKNSVSAWAIKTSEGIILIDTLNNADDAENIVEAGLIELGLDPSAIKYILIAHGHGDHFGGAKYLVDKYGARVVMTEADWPLTLRKPPPGLERSEPPEMDMVAKEGDVLVLGDTEITYAVTPGHTLGTLSFIFDVYDDGTKHTVAFWGGTGFPRDYQGVLDYVESSTAFKNLAVNRGADIELSNHPFVDDSLRRMDAMSANPDAPNPFIIGTQKLDDYFSILTECALATAARREG